MSNNVLHGESLSWIQSDHLNEEVLEFIGVWLLIDLLVSLPEEFSSITSNKAVVRVWNVSSVEWWSL